MVTSPSKERWYTKQFNPRHNNKKKETLALDINMKNQAVQQCHHYGIPHFVPLFNTRNVASTHEKKCPHESCENQHHMPRNVGKDSSTRALGGNTDLSMSCKTGRNQLPSLVTTARSTWKKHTWLTPKDQRALIEDQVFRGEELH